MRDRDLHRTIVSFYGADRAREIRKAIDPQCLSSFTKDDDFAIVSSNVILAVDAGNFIFADCAYEELLQALGPINDTDKVPWTTFNDKVSMGHFGIYDQLLLNLLYHPRMRPGCHTEIASSAEIFPVPDMRSTKMRFRVSSVSASLSTWRVSLNAFAHASSNPSGRSPFTPPTRQYVTVRRAPVTISTRSPGTRAL